tara:strand:+ start:41 stop:775 length:735 start_codon:yes stop_codon:yes gene_type:complete
MADLSQFIEATSALAINEILAPIRDDEGIALPSKYEVLFFPPSGTRGSGGAGATSNLFSQIMFGNIGRGEQRDISMQCNKIEFPGRNLDTVADTNIYGPTREIVNGFSFAEITANFYQSSNYKEKQFFETWQRLSYDPNTWAMQYYDDYVGKIQIYSLDRGDNRRYGVELVECFPKTIAAQSLDASPATTPQTCDISFSYRYWRNLTDEADLPKPLLERLQGVLANQVERTLTNNIPKVLRKLF